MNKFKALRNASILGLIGNLFLLIIKTSVGLISNSQSMIADALNSASDIFSSIMAYIGNKISSIPKDENYNLGHGKAEYFYSLLISITMCLISLSVLKNAFISFFHSPKYTFNIWLVIVCIITIIIKINLYLYTNKLSKKHNSLLLEATSKDHLNDSLLTLLNLIACILSVYKIYFFDGIASIIIAICIFTSAIKIFKKSYDVLMDKSINKRAKKQIYSIIKKHKEVIRISNFTSSPIGYQYQISFTIHLNGNFSTFESHSVASAIEKEIKKAKPDIYLVTIHINPVDIKPLNKRLRRKIHNKINIGG